MPDELTHAGDLCANQQAGEKLADLLAREKSQHVRGANLKKLRQNGRRRDPTQLGIVAPQRAAKPEICLNEWIGWMNDLIIFVLLVGILLHNFAQDTGWNFGKYLAEIVAAVCGAVCFIGKPFADGGAFYRSKKTRESHAGW